MGGEDLKMCLVTRPRNGIIDYDPLSWLYGQVFITREITEATCKDSPEKTISEHFEISPYLTTC